MARSLSRRQIQDIADQRADAILAIVDGQPGPVSAVSVSWYPTPEDFEAVCPEPGWTYEDWAAVTGEVISILEGEGIGVRTRELRAAPYFSYIDRLGLENTPQNRARYLEDPFDHSR